MSWLIVPRLSQVRIPIPRLPKPHVVVVDVHFLQTPHCAFLCAASGPSAQTYDNNMLPELPSVPDTLPNSSFGGNNGASDDIDFDDLSRRFEELKKKT